MLNEYSNHETSFTSRISYLHIVFLRYCLPNICFVCSLMMRQHVSYESIRRHSVTGFENIHRNTSILESPSLLQQVFVCVTMFCLQVRSCALCPIMIACYDIDCFPLSRALWHGLKWWLLILGLRACCSLRGLWARLSYLLL